MQQDILINWSPQETRVAVVENGSVQELHVERTLERGLVGNVYLGKVARVLPGMQSAFVDIGLERAAFLHVADVWTRQPEGEPPQGARSSCAVSCMGNPMMPEYEPLIRVMNAAARPCTAYAPALPMGSPLST